MSDGSTEAHMPENADVQRRSREFFATWSPGQEAQTLNGAELDRLVAAADHLIPGVDPWPRPSRLDVRDYFARGARRKSDVAMLREIVGALTSALEAGGEAARAALRALQRDKPVHFRALQEFVYYAYYAQPEVVRVIRSALHCDYISPPLPRGYAMDPARVEPRGRGSFRATEQVRRVDVSGIDFTEE